MNMNCIAKVCATVALGLSLMGASLAADAASARTSATHAETSASPYTQGKVIHLGTIVVTPPKAAQVDFSKTRGSTAYLGTVKVTAADSAESRMAARAARSQGAMYLGVVQVGREDSLDARYAQRLAAERGGAYLGTVQVMPKGAEARTLAGLVMMGERLANNMRFVVLGTLAFDRAGG